MASTISMDKAMTTVSIVNQEKGEKNGSHCKHGGDNGSLYGPNALSLSGIQVNCSKRMNLLQSCITISRVNLGLWQPLVIV